ncbi:MAG: Peptide methionine sulfoxide reductase MsrB [Chlamydiia bacterium]|nr:Peptide methionine sulfoxide reductase MsrB [Chlamydiia bacterium]MCH9615251.1 Peptide methionine sulfoxide reductase MsrB [Chlamydiia bacterium]MCH9628427.1 Peptide methionine sulfoxide reductase MsrB [Chlamydiia bacterium]
MKILFALCLIPLALFSYSRSTYCFDGKKLNFSEKEWKKRLTAEEFSVMRGGKEEAPDTGKFVNYTKEGLYECAACDLVLFNSKAKIAPEDGYATFTHPICPANVDHGNRFHRWSNAKFVTCARCGAKLGTIHYEPDAHYRIFSISLEFSPDGRPGAADVELGGLR